MPERPEVKHTCGRCHSVDVVDLSNVEDSFTRSLTLYCKICEYITYARPVKAWSETMKEIRQRIEFHKPKNEKTWTRDKVRLAFKMIGLKINELIETEQYNYNEDKVTLTSEALEEHLWRRLRALLPE